MKDEYPSLIEAEAIVEEVFEFRKKHFPQRPLSERYLFHIQGVAKAAKMIAEKIADMNPEKAYVLGYLHDCGKRLPEKEAGKFHGLEGFDFMLEKGYPAVAQICLTHTFPEKNFADTDFAYPQSWKDATRQKLETIEYNDYDRLIQLCDRLFEVDGLITLEARAKEVAKRYELSAYQYQSFLNTSTLLKKYFDEKCGRNIYSILEIEE